MPTGPDVEWKLVVIGDSSLWLLADAFAAQVEADTGVTVIPDDRTVGGLSAGKVLQGLTTQDTGNLRLDTLREALAEADVVVMFVNPEDSMEANAGAALGKCFGFSPTTPPSTGAFDGYTEDLTAIWAEIFRLRKGKPTVLRATDIYMPLVSRWQERGMFEACTAWWEQLSEADRAVADAYGIPFLSRYDAYNGPDHTEDPREKGYIRSDGEHPTPLAAQMTAQLLSEMGYAPVSPP
jgi:lysophospholipase L1-like esterase